MKNIILSNKLPFIALSSLLALSAHLQAGEAKLIYLSSGGGLGQDEFMIQPMGYQEGITLAFLLEGKNFVAFDEKSLKADGWKLGSFPRVAKKERNKATFMITKKGDFLGKEASVKVAGLIDILTAENKKVHKAKGVKDKAVQFGPVKATVVIDTKNEWSMGIKLEGDFSVINKVSWVKDGKEQECRGWSGFNNVRTYQAKGIKDGDELVIEYWENAKKVTYTFKK